MTYNPNWCAVYTRKSSDDQRSIYIGNIERDSFVRQFSFDKAFHRLTGSYGFNFNAYEFITTVRGVKRIIFINADNGDSHYVSLTDLEQDKPNIRTSKDGDRQIMIKPAQLTKMAEKYNKTRIREEIFV